MLRKHPNIVHNEAFIKPKIVHRHNEEHLKEKQMSTESETENFK
jgi:hypothetical protein